MTTCEFCQHPSCWKSDINSYNVQLNRDKEKYNHSLIRNDDVGKLPTYNFLSFNFGGSNDTLDGLEYEQDYEGDDADESSSDEGDLINSVKRFKFGLAQSYLSGCSITPNISANISFLNYIQKLRQRQKQLEKEEHHKNQRWREQEKRLVLQNLKLDSRFSFTDDFEKVFTWVPGKKKIEKESKDNNESWLSSTVIDGDALPDHLKKRQNETKCGHRSPTGRKSRIKPKQREIEELSTFIHEELTLEDYIKLFNLPGLCGYDLDNRGTICMPSPLRTARMDIIPHKVKAQNSGTARQVPTSDTMTRNIRTAHPIDNTTMYIEGGSQRQKSLVFLQSREREELKKFKKKHQKSTAFSNEPDKKCCRKSDEKQKKKRRKHPNILELKLRKEKQSRGLLGLTHVSIPRRALKRYPLFTHCKQSIRKDALDNDVVIQPLSGSERSSLCELSISDPTSKSQDGTKELQELVDVDRNTSTAPFVPSSSPTSLKSRCSVLPDSMQSRSIVNKRSDNQHTSDFIDSSLSHTEFAPVIDSRLSQGTVKGHVPKGRSSVHFQLPRKYSSQEDREDRRTSTAPSFFSSTLFKDCLEEGYGPYSRTASTISKPESEDSCHDKELINRTYDKYQSFTPFKTPLQSQHGMEDEEGLPEQTVNKVFNAKSFHDESISSRNSRPLFPQSMHNLNSKLNSLPDLSDDVIKPNRSFITRMSSPRGSIMGRVKSMQNQGSVPEEMKISQVQLFPNKDRSSFAQNKEVNSEHHLNSLHECKYISAVMKDIACNQAPPPSPALSKKTISASSIKQVLSPHVVDSIKAEEYDDDSADVLAPVNSTSNTAVEVECNDDEETTIEICSDLLNDDDGNDGEDITETEIGNVEDSTLVENEEENIQPCFLNKEYDEVSCEDVKLNKIQGQSTQLDEPLSEQSIALDRNREKNEGSRGSESRVVVDDDDELSSSSASSILEPLQADDFTDGLTLNLELDEEIMRAMQNIDDFILDSDEDDDEEVEQTVC